MGRAARPHGIGLSRLIEVGKAMMGTAGGSAPAGAALADIAPGADIGVSPETGRSQLRLWVESCRTHTRARLHPMSLASHLAIRLAVAVLMAGSWGQPALAGDAPLPTWVKSLIAEQSAPSHTVVEEAIYDGKRVFEILPGDRAADSGDEHILYSEDRSMICTFGGYAGHVTAGSCDIGMIFYRRTLFPPKPRWR
jgi:hypothetical protein